MTWKLWEKTTYYQWKANQDHQVEEKTSYLPTFFHKPMNLLSLRPIKHTPKWLQMPNRSFPSPLKLSLLFLLNPFPVFSLSSSFSCSFSLKIKTSPLESHHWIMISAIPQDSSPCYGIFNYCSRWQLATITSCQLPPAPLVSHWKKDVYINLFITSNVMSRSFCFIISFCRLIID